jgi:hypothetical protein
MLLAGDVRPGVSACGIKGTIVRQMADVLEPDGRHDDVYVAVEALTSTAAPDVEILAAVHDGLHLVPAGSPASWFDVPNPRRGRDDSSIARRRTV